MIEFADVSKRFGETIALSAVSLTLKPGELLGVLGPSGCGKTTLLRVAGGHERIDSGAVILGGRDVTHFPPERRNVGMVFQNYALFPHMTVLQNVEFGLRMRSVSKDQRQRRALDM